MERYVNTVYGSEIDAKNYLHKFITISADLPKNTESTYKNDYHSYSYRLADYYGIRDRIDHSNIFIYLFGYYDFSLREVERWFSIVNLYFAGNKSHNRLIELAACFVSILRVKYPGILKRLASGSITCKELFDETRIGDIPQDQYPGFPKSNLLQVIRFLAISDQDYNKLDSKDPIHNLLGKLPDAYDSRTEIIRNIYYDITQFRCGYID